MARQAAADALQRYRAKRDFAGAGHAPSPSPAGKAKRLVVTHPDYRKRGFGRQVLDAASDAAWQAGCYKVMLMTGSKKPETIRFYLGAGFEQSKTGFQKRRIPHRAEA